MTEIAKAPKWERKRAMVLAEICREVEAARALKHSLVEALQGACGRWANAVLEEAEGKKPARVLRLSPATLRRAFKAWAADPRPEAFLHSYVPGKQKAPQELINEFQRILTMPGMRRSSAAILLLKQRWRNGERIPGLGTWSEWWAAKRTGHPAPEAAPEFPYSETTLYRYLPKQNVRALGNKGVAAFRAASAHIDREYSELKPCELFILDDKRPDILVLDDETGKATDVTIYLMQEAASRRIVGFTCRAANAMCAADVDALIARVLASEGYCETGTHILLERGTVAMTPAAQTLIEFASEGLVKIHRTGMDGGVRAVGFAADRPSGHWQGKGSIESFCNKIDTLVMGLPGQRGNRHENMPANLAWTMKRVARGPHGETERVIEGGEVAEAEELAQAMKASGGKLNLECGLLWLSQFNALLRQIIKEHNASRDHEYEGFGFVTQAETAPGVWTDQPVHSPAN